MGGFLLCGSSPARKAIAKMKTSYINTHVFGSKVSIEKPCHDLIGLGDL